MNKKYLLPLLLQIKEKDNDNSEITKNWRNMLQKSKELRKKWHKIHRQGKTCNLRMS